MLLPYSSALVLGIVAEKPINPYEIKKLLEKLSIRKWLPLAISSLYATIRSLSENGLIGYETAREGNMPEKKVYSANPAGIEALHDTLLDYLGSAELDRKKLNIAMLMICHLPKAEAQSVIGKRIGALEGMEAGLKRVVGGLEGSGAVPYTGVLTVKHELYAVQADLAASRELQRCVEADRSWDHFVTSIL